MSQLKIIDKSLERNSESVLCFDKIACILKREYSDSYNIFITYDSYNRIDISYEKKSKDEKECWEKDFNLIVENMKNPNNDFDVIIFRKFYTGYL